MATYNIRHTDINKDPIAVEEATINSDTFDITLFGRVRLEYGDKLNQNILNILENFAAPAIE